VRYPFSYDWPAHSPGFENKVTLQFGTNSILKLFSKLLHPAVIFVIEERTNTSQILPTITYNCLVSNTRRKLYSHKNQRNFAGNIRNVTCHRISKTQQ
jgi:hypothetical protein